MTEEKFLNNNNIKQGAGARSVSAPFFSKKNWLLKERLFKITLISGGLIILFIVAGIILSLTFNSLPSLKQNGIGFILEAEWDPANGRFGAFPFIVGTLLTAFLALAISLPFSLSITIVLGEYFKKGFFSSFLKTTVELLAGIPSVIYGFWGAFFLIPLVQQLEMGLGVVPYGVGIFTSSVVLAIMIIPYSAAMGREVLELIPEDLKEGAYSLGATRFEVIKNISLPYSISGIIAGIVLSLGRALGETMAVTMLIGNMNKVPENIFSPGQSITSIIVNQFNEANNEMHRASMLELGLLLMAITALITIIGKYIIKRMSVEK
jgi:phosphate transport system permease protein